MSLTVMQEVDGSIIHRGVIRKRTQGPFMLRMKYIAK